MNAIHRGACAAAVALALACARTAHAQTYYTTDTTISNTNVLGDVVIGHNADQSVQTNSSVILDTTASIGHDVQVFNASTFYMNGDVGGDLSGYDNSIITVSGGTLKYNLFADNSSTVNINGGLFASTSQIQAFNSSTLNVRGGSFGTIAAFGNSVINFFGNVTLTNPNPTFGFQGAYTQYALSGTLGNTFIAPNTFLNIVNGSGVKVFFYSAPGSGPSSTLVPEPGSVGLLLGLCVTGAGFAAKRRKRA